MQHTQAVQNLSTLAQEASKIELDDWSILNMSKDDTYAAMASNVLTQFSGVDSDNFNTVALATITNLLVENLVLSLFLQNDESKT